MTSPPLPNASHPLKGVALMLAAMLSIPLVDGLAKYLSTGYSPLFLSWARYAIASAAVLPLAMAMHGRRPFPREGGTARVLRTVFLVTAMSLYFLALSRIALATAASAYFVGPILAVLLSVLLLGEALTLRKILSLGLGFAGALIILSPAGSLDPGILLALAAGCAFAFYLVATRQAARESAAIETLAFQCAVGTALLTPQAVATWAVPAASDLPLFAALGLISAISHVLSIAAFRLADASTLAPLVYVELIGATLVGYWMFAELPSASTLAGAALIVAAGFTVLDWRKHEV
jgi:drug/metabolite transporter (DMT)-like permease